MTRDRISRVFPGIKEDLRNYPRQFWLITIMVMLTWLFHSLMWPYIMLFISQKLNQPLSGVTWLLTLNAAVGMVTTFLGGVIADKFGRKWVMVFSLAISAVGWFFFRNADTLPMFALLMVITGAVTPLYRVASDAMIADLIPDAQRLNAYSIMRMGNNLGVALGPAIGGFLAAISYSISFTVIGVGFGVVALLITLLIVESKPRASGLQNPAAEPTGGYLTILKDRVFVLLLGAFTFNRICTSVLWMMLAPYAKINFGLSERMFGFIPTTNAVMVILLQMLVTRRVNRHQPESAMMLGSLIYAVAVFSVAFGAGFWWFWFCMVVATIGEMILVPTTTTYTSRLAPADMRARYMSLYALTWGIGTGLGPLMAGIANDAFSPQAMWYTAGLAGFAGFGVFWWVARLNQRKRCEAESPAV